MDIIDDCYTEIEHRLEEIDKEINQDRENDSQNDHAQTQVMIDFMAADKDNLDRILKQQDNLQVLIEKDTRIISLNKNIAYQEINIDLLRKACAKIESDSIVARQEQIESQAKELEKFQMQQLKSISDDYKRHIELLEYRKGEIIKIQKEIENEENNREAYLASYARDLEKNLEARRQSRQLGTLGVRPIIQTNRSNVFNDAENLELESVDEYAPYGTAPNSRTNINNTTRRGAGGGSRARRGRGARAPKE